MDVRIKPTVRCGNCRQRTQAQTWQCENCGQDMHLHGLIPAIPTVGEKMRDAVRELCLLLRRQRASCICGRCTYPVRGLESMTCPECGADFRDVGAYPPGAALSMLWHVLSSALFCLFVWGIVGGAIGWPILHEHVGWPRNAPTPADSARPGVGGGNVSDSVVACTKVAIFYPRGWLTCSVTSRSSDGTIRVRRPMRRVSDGPNPGSGISRATGNC